MKFRFEVLAGAGGLADKQEVTVVVWVTADLGGLQIERQAGVLRMYADEARALDQVVRSSLNPDSLDLEFQYTNA